MNWRLASRVTQDEIDAQAITGARWVLRQADGEGGYTGDRGTIEAGTRLFVGEFRTRRGIRGASRAILPIDSVCDEVEWCEAPGRT